MVAFQDAGIGEEAVIDYPLAVPDLVAAACREASRNLTRVEWTQYVGSVDEYQPTCEPQPN